MSRLASQHSVRIPCPSSSTRTYVRDLQRGCSCFAEVPHEMLDPKDWETLCARPYNHAEDTTPLEARAVLRGLEGIAFTELGRNLRQLMLCDNLGLTFAIERWRTRSYKTLMVIRRIAGVSLARNIRLSIPWMASETNSADEPSRFFESGSLCSFREPRDGVLVGSHISDRVFRKEENDDNRKPAPPDKMTLQLFILLCFDVPSYVISSLHFFPDTNRFATCDSEPAPFSHFDETKCGRRRGCHLQTLGEKPKRSRVLPRRSVFSNSQRRTRTLTSLKMTGIGLLGRRSSMGKFSVEQDKNKIPARASQSVQ